MLAMNNDLVYLMVTTIFSPFSFALKLYFLYIMLKHLIDYYKRS